MGGGGMMARRLLFWIAHIKIEEKEKNQDNKAEAVIGLRSVS